MYYTICLLYINVQRKKDELDDKDEFDVLAEEGQKTLADRLGTSPEMIEKKSKVKRGNILTTDDIVQFENKNGIY